MVALYFYRAKPNPTAPAAIEILTSSFNQVVE
jgi:hypothetical protein